MASGFFWIARRTQWPWLWAAYDRLSWWMLRRRLRRLHVGCTCEWDDDGNPIGGHFQGCPMWAATPIRPATEED